MINTFHLVHNTDNSYGGPAKSIPYLMGGLEKLGTSQELISLKLKDYEQNEVVEKLNLKSTSFKVWFSKATAYSPYLENYLINRIKETNNQIIHYHNIWNYIPLVANKVSKKFDIPIVVSPRGNLFPWNLNKGFLKKRIYMDFFQRKYFQDSNCIHVTSKAELDAVKNLGFKAPIGLIPNGVALSEFNNIKGKQFHRKNLGLDNSKKYILYMGRIEEKKGLHILLKSYIDFLKENENWRVLIAGPIYNKKYFNYCMSLINTKGLGKYVKWLNMVSGTKRIDAYGASDLFILPTKSENFGIVVAEALASGIPVITTTGTPWEEIQKEFAGFIIPPKKEFLTSAISDFSNLNNDQKCEMKMNAKKISKRYSWDKPAEDMHLLYEWILGKKKQPKFIF